MRYVTRSLPLGFLFAAILIFILGACSAVESTGQAVDATGQGIGNAVSGTAEAVGDAGSAIGHGAGRIISGTGEAIEDGAEKTAGRGY